MRALSVTVVGALSLVLSACGVKPPTAPVPDAAPAAAPVPEAPVTASPAPCRSSADMARLDGQTVLLEGVYRKHLEQLSMARPGRPAPEPVFRGMIVLELQGSPAVYDPSMPDDELTLVQLGQEARSEAELASFLDKRVIVQGRLVLDPASLLSEEELEMARPDGLPTLVSPGQPTLAPGAE